MVNERSVLVNVETICSANDTVDALKRLDALLVRHSLGQFSLFNKTYIIVTDLIRQSLEDGSFKNPEYIEKCLVDFAGYYFHAVNKSYRKDADIPLAWAKLNQYATLPSAPVFISLMLGANAHINNDLPHVLHNLMPVAKADGFLEDLAKIDTILMKSGKEAIGLFEEHNKLYDFLKRRSQFMYYRPAMYTILYWRVNARRGYRRLQKHQGASQGITDRSARIADRLLRIARILVL